MSAATLFNGQQVKLGDRVRFTNSDSEVCEGVIKQRQDGSLYFWNIGFPITAYRSAVRCDLTGQFCPARVEQEQGVTI